MSRRGLVERVAPSAYGRDFRPFLAASWVANIGDGIVLAAGPLLIASQTSSPGLVALATILQRLPWFIFGLGAGIVADRLNRIRLVLIGNLCRVAVLALLVATIVTDQVNVTLVLVAMFLLGTAETLADTATDAVVPMIVPADQLGVANARVVFGFQALNMLAGPPIGALLFATGMFIPFAAQGVALLLAAVLISRIRVEDLDRTPDSSAWTELVEGVRWLWANGPIRTLAVVIFAFNLTWGATNAIIVLYALERLELSDQGFGLLLATAAIGGVIGAASYGWLEARFRLGTMMQVGLTLETLSHLGFALTTSWVVAFAIMFVFGVQASVWGTTGRAIRQRAVPSAFQGRVGSAYMFSVHTGLVIGGVIGGAIGSWFGITAVYWYAFVGSALFLAALWRQMPLIAHAPAVD